MFENFINEVDEKLINRGKIIVRDLTSIKKIYCHANERIQVADYNEKVMNELHEANSKLNKTQQNINDLHLYLQALPQKIQSDVFSIIDNTQGIDEQKQKYKFYELRDKINQELKPILQGYDMINGKITDLQNDLNFMVSEFDKQNYKVDQAKTIPQKLKRFLIKIDEFSIQLINPLIITYTELKYGLNRISKHIERTMKK